MARADYWQYLVDRRGRPLEDAEVRIYLAGTLIEANIFTHPEFGSFNVSSSVDLKTNKFGFVQFWIGDQWEIEGGYDEDQLFKIVWQNTVDGIEEEIDNLLIFSAVRPINTSNDNTDLDKVISNKQGHKWDTHVDSIVPSASPHDLEPVVFFDLNNLKNKVISNKLGYQMYEMARTASTTDVDVSGARFFSQQINTTGGETQGWQASGGAYWVRLRHNFNNYFVILKLFKTSNWEEVTPKRVESYNPNNTIVWIDELVQMRASIFG
jgi:hypothetical protein